jgi:hypothetical protein
MKRIAALLLLLTTGCSTAPLADLLDCLSPGKLPAGGGRYRGGVGNLYLPPPTPNVTAPPGPPAEPPAASLPGLPPPSTPPVTGPLPAAPPPRAPGTP